MIQAKCLDKLRNKNGQIVSYRLQDKNNEILEIIPDKLKQAIKENKIQVINLKLTSDNRLVNISNKDKVKLVASNKKELPVKMLNARLICIADGAFYDYSIKSYPCDKLLINPYISIVNNPTGIYEGMSSTDVDLKPFTLYNKKLSNNEILLLDSSYKWAYNEVEFIDKGMAYRAWCKINLVIVKQINTNNGSKILVDIDEQEALKHIHRVSIKELVEKIMNTSFIVSKYKLDVNKHFNKNTVKHITVKNVPYSDIRYKFLKEKTQFIYGRISDRLDKDTLDYVVNDFNFNWVDNYNYLHNCNIKWSDGIPNVYSLDAYITIMIVSLEDYILARLFE